MGLLKGPFGHKKRDGAKCTMIEKRVDANKLDAPKRVGTTQHNARAQEGINQKQSRNWKKDQEAMPQLSVLANLQLHKSVKMICWNSFMKFAPLAKPFCMGCQRKAMEFSCEFRDKMKWASI